jgi:hypothetical protein
MGRCNAGACTHFAILDVALISGIQHQTSLVALLLSVLSALLTLLSSHCTYQRLGQPILKTLLSPQWMRRLNSFVRGSHSELILATLRLLNSMSAFASGKERKTILESFAWESKVRRSRCLLPALWKHITISLCRNCWLCGAK